MLIAYRLPVYPRLRRTMRRSTVARNWRAAAAKVTVEEEPPEMVNYSAFPQDRQSATDAGSYQVPLPRQACAGVANQSAPSCRLMASACRSRAAPQRDAMPATASVRS